MVRALIGDAPDLSEADRRFQAAQEHSVLLQAAWATLAVKGPEPVEQAYHGVHLGLHSMQSTLLARRDSSGDRDRNVRYVECHAVEVTMASERLGTFTSAARSALVDANPGRPSRRG
ncbi:hypothetical protein VR45_39690 [Streptomyces sp. NRRL S-495]|nr:hypothetical protein VR45_39690 [Streptomyces sp. NRRL S-495]